MSDKVTSNDLCDWVRSLGFDPVNVESVSICFGPSEYVALRVYKLDENGRRYTEPGADEAAMERHVVDLTSLPKLSAPRNFTCGPSGLPCACNPAAPRAAAPPRVTIDVEPSPGLKAMQLWRRLTGRSA